MYSSVLDGVHVCLSVCLPTWLAGWLAVCLSVYTYMWMWMCVCSSVMSCVNVCVINKIVFTTKNRVAIYLAFHALTVQKCNNNNGNDDSPQSKSLKRKRVIHELMCITLCHLKKAIFSFSFRSIRYTHHIWCCCCCCHRRCCCCRLSRRVQKQASC